MLFFCLASCHVLSLVHSQQTRRITIRPFRIRKGEATLVLYQTSRDQISPQMKLVARPKPSCCQGGCATKYFGGMKRGTKSRYLLGALAIVAALLLFLSFHKTSGTSTVSAGSQDNNSRDLPVVDYETEKRARRARKETNTSKVVVMPAAGR